MITVMGATGHTGGEVARRLLRAGRAGAGAGALGGEARRRSPRRRRGLRRRRRRPRLPDRRLPRRGRRLRHAAVRSGRARPPGVAAPAGRGDRRRPARRRRAATPSPSAPSAPTSPPAPGSSPACTSRRRACGGWRAAGRTCSCCAPASSSRAWPPPCPLIEAQGYNADAVDPDVPLPAVAAADVGGRRGRGPAGARLAGHRRARAARPARPDLPPRPRASSARRIGRPDLAYVQLPDAALAAALSAAGYSPQAAALHVEMARAFSDGTVAARGARSAANSTGRTFEAFVAALPAARAAARRPDSPGGDGTSRAWRRPSCWRLTCGPSSGGGPEPDRAPPAGGATRGAATGHALAARLHVTDEPTADASGRRGGGGRRRPAGGAPSGSRPRADSAGPETGASRPTFPSPWGGIPL